MDTSETSSTEMISFSFRRET